MVGEVQRTRWKQDILVFATSRQALYANAQKNREKSVNLAFRERMICQMRQKMYDGKSMPETRKIQSPKGN